MAARAASTSVRSPSSWPRPPASSTRSPSGSATRADDTFGFGVVFSDETLGGIEHADPVVFAADAARVRDLGRHRRPLQGRGRSPAAATRFAAMSRRRLLEILQQRCRDLGVDLRFRTQAPDVAELAASYDLVVACDGLNSAVRSRYADTFRPSLDVRDCRYMWLGTDKVFDAFKFHIRETPYGVMQIHGYPYDATGSTFIVEMTSEVWRRAGFERTTSPDRRAGSPGESDEKSIAMVRELFADVLDGHEVLANNSRWISFTTVRNELWVHEQRRAARRRRPHRTLLDRLRHQARDGGRPRPGRLPARGADGGRGARDVRGGTQGRRALHPARGAGQPGVVREPRAVRPPGPDPVRVQHHDPLAAGHLRQPPRPRPGVRRALRGVVRLVGRAASSVERRARRDHTPPMFQPVTLRAANGPGTDAPQPGDRLADGPVRRGWTACRPTSTSCTSAARRSAGRRW